jgi:hypothetical protein
MQNAQNQARKVLPMNGGTPVFNMPPQGLALAPKGPQHPLAPRK